MTRFFKTLQAMAFVLIVLANVPAHAGVKGRNAAEKTVIALLETAFNQKKPAEAFDRYGGPYYRQHNPTAPDGKEAIVALLKGWLPTVPSLHYDIKRIVSHGNMVWVHSHVTMSPGDRGQAVVDIFRLERGKVVEHWDVGTPVPEKPLNSNTMF